MEKKNRKMSWYPHVLYYCGAAEDERVFTPEAAPSPSRGGQIYPKSQGQVILAWHD